MAYIKLSKGKYIRTLNNYKRLIKDVKDDEYSYYKYKKLVDGKWSKLN